MSGAKVDVLFDMRDCAAILGAAKQEPAALRLLDGHDAVAELIVADRDYDAALTALSDLNRQIAEHGWIEVEHDALRNAGARLVRAQSRRCDALANIGPQP